MIAAILAAVLLSTLTSTPGRERTVPQEPAASKADIRTVAPEGFATGADGVRLFYRKVGHGATLAVVVHGGPALSMNMVWPDLEPLAQKFTILMYDQRGGGRSELITDAKLLTAQKNVDDLEAFRRYFDLPSMTLICQSWGAGLCSLYAEQHPTRVKRLVLLGPMPPTKELLAQRDAALSAQRSPGFARLPELLAAISTADDPVALCREFNSIYFKSRFADPAAFVRMRSDACAAPPAAIRNFPANSGAVMGSLGDWDFRPGLRELRMPVLIVEGAKSFPTLEGIHVWAKSLPDGRLLLIPNAGHFPMVEQPDLFFPAVEQFLAGKWPAGATAEFEKAN